MSIQHWSENILVVELQDDPTFTDDLVVLFEDTFIQILGLFVVTDLLIPLGKGYCVVPVLGIQLVCLLKIMQGSLGWLITTRQYSGQIEIRLGITRICFQCFMKQLFCFL